jgi:hypothetical protein
MKPERPSTFADAASLDGRSHGRTPAVLLRISERDNFIRAAARFFPGGTDREVARKLHDALSTYRGGRWQRDRRDNLCPPQHKGKLMAVLWMILKVHDRLGECSG